MASILLDTPVVTARTYLPATTIRSRHSDKEFHAVALTQRHVDLLRLALSRETERDCGMFTNAECTPEERSALSVRGFVYSPMLSHGGWVVLAEGRAFLAILDAEGSAA